MIITAKSDEVTRIDFHNVKAGWSKKILFLSDVHKDSIWCDTKLLKQHLEEAKEEDAAILIAGDLFDAMQGQYDPRMSFRELKVSLKGNDYFDRVLDDVFQFFKPYAKNLAMLGYGNHEYSVVRHNGTDLVQRFVQLMRNEGSQIVAGGYGGFIRLSIYDALKTPRETKWIYYNHGAGGEAPVTKGAIQTNRQATWVRNVDAIWNGHNHQSYIMSQSTLEPTGKDGIKQSIIYFLRTPGYKNEMQKPAHGFAASKNMSPTPRGCIWGDMIYGNDQISMRYTQDIE